MITISPVQQADDPWIKHAIEIIKADYGVDVSLKAKNKDLLKFGRNELVGTSKATIMTLPTGILNETFVSTNAITTISSSSAADTYDIVVEGHTISGTDLTFVTQTITLNGQTQVSLSTPLARVNRTYVTGSTNSVGNIYIYENDTDTAGVPDTAATVHLIQQAGINNSEKASTSISSTDFWVITGFYGDVLEKTAAYATIHFETRVINEVFRNKVDISASTYDRGVHEFKPYLIIPPNSDVRLRALADGANTDISGGIQGALLTT